MSVEKDIEAVKFLLASFRRFPNEVNRQTAITDEAKKNECVDIYAEYSCVALMEQLSALQKQLSHW